MICVVAGRLWLPVLVALSAAGVVLALYQTRFGAEATDDSVLYIAAARDIASGRGFSWVSGEGETRPITGFPPGYSALLAVPGILGIDYYDGARLANSLLLGANIALTGLLIHRTTRSAGAALLGGLLVLAMRDVLVVHAWIMAECLFITAVLLSVYVVSWYVESPRLSRLACGALLAGSAVLVRYIGIGLIPVCALGPTAFAPRPWRRRVADTLSFVLLSASPFAVLALANLVQAGTAVNRSVEPLRPSYEVLVSYLNEAFSWFVPEILDVTTRLRWKLAILLLLLVILPMLLIYRSTRPSFPWQDGVRARLAIPVLMLGFMVAYAGVLVMWISTDTVAWWHVVRYLTPLFVASVVLIVCVWHGLLWGARIWPPVKAAAAVLFVSVGIMHGLETLSFITAQDTFYTLQDIKRDSPGTVETLQSLDPSRQIFTNEIYMVYYFANRPASQVPMMSAASGQGWEDFELQMEAYRRKMGQGAVLVLFDSIQNQVGQFPPKETLIQGLVMRDKIWRGAVYSSPER